MPKRLALLIAFVTLVITANLFSNEQTPSQASVESLEADVRFLSSDLLEGREAGTRGYDLAALYVEQRFRALVLKPGGDDGEEVADGFEDAICNDPAAAAAGNFASCTFRVRLNEAPEDIYGPDRVGGTIQYIAPKQ